MSTVITPLEAIGIEEGSDKGFLQRGYIRHYEPLFSSFRDMSFNLISIGPRGDGVALQRWSILVNRESSWLMK
jgi:hypothetical protein